MSTTYHQLKGSTKLLVCSLVLLMSSYSSRALKPNFPAWCLCPYVGDVAAASEPHALLQDAVSVVNFTRLALSCLCQPLGLRVAL